MRRNTEEINLALALCFQDLRDVALADGVISDDERAILEEIEKQFVSLEEQLFQILESDLEISEFNDIANDILHDIVEKALSVARKDDIVTEEEELLLKKLKEFIHNEGHFND